MGDVYDGFLSYSHAADEMLAPALQGALQRYAKPWYRRRSLSIFRDQTGLSANPHLWTSIAAALDSSRFFVLLSSPDAARSDWVGKEIDHWVQRNGTEHLLPVVTDGTWVWDPQTADFDWERSTAVHPALRGVFAEEPRHVDMVWARSELQLDHRDGRFLDAVAEIAAPMHGVAKDELAGEEVRQHRRTMRTARGAAVAMAVLVAVALVASVVAVGQRNDARNQTRIAESQSLIAQSRGLAAEAVTQAPVALDRSLLLAIEAVRRDRNSQSTAGLLTALASAHYLVGFRPEFDGGVADLALSPDEETVAVAHLDGRVRLHDTETFEVLDETSVDDVGQLQSVRYQTDGRRLHVYGDRGARLVSIPDLTPVSKPFTLDSADQDPLVDVTDDGTKVALTLASDLYEPPFQDNEIEVRDVATGRAMAQLADPCFVGASVASETSSLNWSPDGDALAVACTTGPPVVINPTTGSVTTAQAPVDIDRARLNRCCSRLEFSPTGDRIAGSGQAGVTVFDTTTLDPVAGLVNIPVRGGGNEFSISPYEPALRFSPDGRQLAISGGDGSFQVWFVETAHRVAEPEGLGDSVAGLAFLHTAANVPFLRLLVGTRATMSEWDLSDGGLSEIVNPKVGGVLLGVSEGGTQYETTGTAELSVVDAPGEVTAEIELASPVDLAYPSPDGRYVVVVRDHQGEVVRRQVVKTTDAGFDLYRVADGELVSEVPVGAFIYHVLFDQSANVDHYASVEFSPDSRWLAVQTTDQVDKVSDEVVVVATSDGRVVARVETEPGAAMSWSGDGSFLATGGASGALRTWDVQDDFRARPDIPLVDSISGLAPAGDTDQVVVTVPDPAEVWVADIGAGRLTKGPFVSAGLELDRGVMSPDGRLVAAFTRDGLQLWDTETRIVLGPAFRGVSHLNWRTDPPVFTAPDVIVSQVRGLSLLGQEVRLDVDHWVEVACRLAGRQLSEDEWERYLPGEPYASTC